MSSAPSSGTSRAQTPSTTAAPPRRRVRRTTTAALLRDTLVTAPLLVVVLLVVLGSVALWTGRQGADQCCVASASGVFIGLYQCLAAVSVTALLVPHVAAGGRRADFSAALLVKHVLVTAFFTAVLTAVAAVDGSAADTGLLVWAVSWAAGLTVLAATGTLMGAALRRWGRAAWLLLPVTTSPLTWFWFHGDRAAHQTPGSLLQTAAVITLTGLAAHLVLRSTPLPAHP